MSITTIYKCDHCGSEQKTSEQFWTIGVVVRPNNASISKFDVPDQHLRMHVCRPCLLSLGLLVNQKQEIPTVEHYPTLEDLIKEIVENAIGELRT